MPLEVFAEELRKELEEQLGGAAAVRLHTFVRNNGSERLALCVIPAGRCVSPAIYVEDYYRRFLAGATRQEILLEICRKIRRQWEEPIPLQSFADWEHVEKRIFAMLVNTARNEKRLDSCPHREILDLSILYYLQVEIGEGGLGIAVVHDEHCDLWGCTPEQLHETAMRNLQERRPAVCLPIAELIGNRVDASDCLAEEKAEIHQLLEEEDVPLYVLTSRDKHLGAVAAICEGELKRQCSRLGWSRLYLLPSSIHEILILPGDCGLKPEKLQRIVREVNREAVRPEEFLSDSLYRYDRDDDRLEIVEVGPETA